MKITRPDGTVEEQAPLPAKQPANYVGGTYRNKARARAAVAKAERGKAEAREPKMLPPGVGKPKGKNRRYFPPATQHLEGALYKRPENRGTV